MADIHSNIKPTGLAQADLVDLLYQILSSIYGICAKLDADSGVPLTTYVANCWTAKINTIVYDSKGNMTGRGGNFTITPTGLTDEALINVLYEIFDSWKTLTAQLDTDVLGSSDYEATYYTATFLGIVTKGTGASLGNGTSYYFGPISPPDQAKLVDLLYQIVYSIEKCCEHLDADTTVNNTNYEALWFTANILNIIENSAGNVIGNAKPY